MGTLFESISVNVVTGAISYPSPEGFVLDVERVYRSAARFAAHCTTTELAVRHAIHEQLSAYIGTQSLLRRPA